MLQRCVLLKVVVANRTGNVSSSGDADVNCIVIIPYLVDIFLAPYCKHICSHFYSRRAHSHKALVAYHHIYTCIGKGLASSSPKSGHTGLESRCIHIHS